MISQYFTTKRALATGIVMSGGAAGALVQTRLHQYLIETLGWRQSLRIFSGLMILCIMAGFTYLPLNPKGTLPLKVICYGGFMVYVIAQEQNYSQQQNGLVRIFNK